MESLAWGWCRGIWRLVFLLWLLRGFDVHGDNQWITWEIKVFTVDEMLSDTSANVYIRLHGTKDNSKIIPLNHYRNSFRRGSIDTFHVVTSDIGELCSLVIGHDDMYAFPAWHLNKIEIKSLTSDAIYIFSCECWISSTEGDKTLIRTIMADRPCKEGSQKFASGADEWIRLKLLRQGKRDLWTVSSSRRPVQAKDDVQRTGDLRMWGTSIEDRNSPYFL